MVVCSCNWVDTEMIRQSVSNHPNTTPKEVITRLGWQSQCGICAKTLVDEVRKVMEDVNNGR